MNFRTCLKLCACTFLVSCAPIESHSITYNLGDSYSSAHGKISGFHKSQERKFSLIQDQIIAKASEVRPGEECEYSLSRHAFDIGTRTLHRSSLSRAGAGSIYRVTEVERPDTMSIPALLKLNPPPYIEQLDSWVMSNLNVTQRTESGGTR